MVNNRVVLIDDDDDFAFVMKLMLETQGYDCIVAENGKEGLKKISDQCPGTVITDIKLPDIKGTELSQKIKTIYPDIKVIILSAISSVNKDAVLKESNADYFFSKPVDKDELFKVIPDTEDI